MKNIKILCLCFGFFTWNSALHGAAVAEDLGATAAKSFEKALAKSSAWGERFNMAFDMGMPMGAAMAASNANEFLSEEQAAVFEDFSMQTNAVTNGLKSWSANQGSLISKQMNAISSYFSNQSSAINNSQASAQKNAQAEANYLFQNLSLQQPASNLVSLAGASSFDQLFSTAIMATPASNFTWYNVLGLGDWVFDPTTNSFWQNQAVPFPTKSTDASTQASNIDVLSSNNIFVEYYPSQKPYTITGSFTLYKVTYPFFVGIMLNKNRWISGNQEGEQKCRLLGIYATSESAANIYCAEQYELSAADAKAKNDMVPIKIPLFQIMNGLVNPLASLSSTFLQTINSQPITCNFSVTTNPTSIAFKIWAASDKEPAQATLIQNLDSSLYLYHTLGFMSPGAATEWKITSPTELTFSSQAITNLKNKVFPSKPVG